MHRDHRHQYSAQGADCTNYHSADDQKVFDELTAIASAQDVGEAATDDELFAALDDAPVASVSKNVPAAKTASKNVPAAASKNVPRRSRRADDKIIEKIRSFRVAPYAPHLSSLVSTHHPSTTPFIAHPVTASTTPHHQALATPTPANDNLIPVWQKTSDSVKAFSACVALQVAETSPVAFTFNLTSEAIARARNHPAGFLDALKRDFDKELKRALGYVFPYMFAIDISDDGEQRLHIHGAFTLPVVSLWTLRKVRNAMRKAWGDWQGAGRRKQVRFETLYSDGWATYMMQYQKEVARMIGKRTLTINQPLRREAEQTYTIVRSIMRRDIIE